MPTHEEIIEQARQDYQTAARDELATDRIIVLDSAIWHEVSGRGWWVPAQVWVGKERFQEEEL